MALEFADQIPVVLEEYWLGPKGSARVGGWGNPGSYTACVRELRSEGVPEHMVHGECANLYHKATGNWPGRPKEHGLTAAAEVHTGAMIALIPAAPDAERLAMDGGEPVEELHVTLCYLGQAADYDIRERLMLATAVAGAVEMTRVPVEGDAFATAYFNVGNPDVETALVYLIGGEAMVRLHRDAAGAAGSTFGPKIPDQHEPWVAHITAAYTDDLDAHRGLVAKLGPVTFDRVRIAFGDQIYDIPLEPADQPGGQVETQGEGMGEPVPLGDVLLGESDFGNSPVPAGGDGLGELPDDGVAIREMQAQARLVDVDVAGLVAAMGAYAPVRWHGPLAPIGTPTGDKRIFNPGAIGQATFPQPLRWQPTGLAGHDGAITVAVISHAVEGTWNGVPHIIGEGYFLDPEIIPEVRQALHLVENGVSGPSVDLDAFAAMVGEYQGKQILVVTEGRQRAATLVAIPAFADLRITLEHPEDNEAANAIMEAMVASAIVNQDDMAQVLPFIVEMPAEFATTSTKGWQSAPIAPRSSSFDADDAVKRIQEWAGIGTDAADEAKFRSMFLWAKPEQLDQDNVPLGSAGYRLPWGDIFDGKPYLVYHAVYAGSALLEGGHGGLPNIPDTDKAQLRNTITKIYSRLSDEFNDPSVRASWDVQEAGAMETETFGARVYDGIHPPAGAFAQKKLTGKTKWTVVPRDGYNEVYGHLAAWDTCHMGLQIGNPNVCAKPPRSRRGYKDFHISTVLTAEGSLVEVGKFTIDAYHGSTKRGLTAAQIRSHYEHTGSEAAVGRVYEDEWGPAFFGVQVPDTDQALAQKMRRTPASGHWHPVDGHLELVAALGVNRPAFPIVASAADGLVVDESTIILMEDEVQTGLIASAFSSEEQMAAGDEEDCGCGSGSQEAKLRAARIMGMDPIPTHAELQARQSRLASHLRKA